MLYFRVSNSRLEYPRTPHKTAAADASKFVISGKRIIIGNLDLTYAKDYYWKSRLAGMLLLAQ